MAHQVEDFLLPLLKKIAIENHFTTSNIQLRPISTLGANYTSSLYLANISGKSREHLRLFIKVAVTGGQLREITDIDLYALERFVYTELIPTFKELEDRYRVADQHRFRFPKYYASDSTHLREVLVLEDLSSEGFILHDRTKPVDWEYGSAAIIQLARFHALSIASTHNNPQLAKKLLETFRHKTYKADGGMSGFLDIGLKKALAAVRQENREKLSKFLEQNNFAKFCDFYETTRRAVLLHGDYRPSNIIHKYRKDGTVEIIPVDYQTMQYGSLVMDFLYFVYTALDSKGRAQFYNKLVELYYSELGYALRRFGLLVENVLYTEEEFRQELDERLPYALQLSVLILPVILVSETDAPPVESGLDIDIISNVVTGELYEKRINEVVDEFIALGVLA